MATEIERLIKEGQVERIQNCTEYQYLIPIVITVKRDGSLKLALDSKELNTAVCKNKYQMPNIEDLMDRIAELISAKSQEKIVLKHRFETCIRTSALIIENSRTMQLRTGRGQSNRHV